MSKLVLQDRFSARTCSPIVSLNFINPADVRQFVGPSFVFKFVSWRGITQDCNMGVEREGDTGEELVPHSLGENYNAPVAVI